MKRAEKMDKYRTHRMARLLSSDTPTMIQQCEICGRHEDYIVALQPTAMVCDDDCKVAELLMCGKCRSVMPAREDFAGEELDHWYTVDGRKVYNYAD